MLSRYLQNSTVVFLPKPPLQYSLQTSSENSVLPKKWYSKSTMEEYLIQQVVSWEEAVSDIENVLDSRHQDWRSCLPIARGIMALQDNVAPGAEPLNVNDQIRMTSMLQRLAYEDADNGAQADISTWCERQWATILQNNPDNPWALQGLGHAWLWKSQEILARIYSDEGSSSSDANGSPSTSARRGPGGRGSGLGSAQLNARINSPDFVQARDLLRPSLESFDRAIDIADSQGIQKGELLSLGAEAYMHMGNVSHPRVNEQFYQRTLRYLQQASNIEGYALEAHLQQFLEENLQFLN